MTYFDIYLVGANQRSLVVTKDTKIDFIRNKLSKKKDMIELVYKGQILEDGSTLDDYRITDDCIIYYHILDYIYDYINKSKTPNADNTTSQLNNLVNSLQDILQIQLPAAVETNTYQAELEQLEQLGLTETEQNRSLLELYGGNVEAVANILLGI